jgi:hypothetical protein
VLRLTFFLRRPDWLGQVDSDQHYLRLSPDRLEGSYAAR